MSTYILSLLLTLHLLLLLMTYVYVMRFAFCQSFSPSHFIFILKLQSESEHTLVLISASPCEKQGYTEILQEAFRTFLGTLPLYSRREEKTFEFHEYHF